MNVKIGGKYIRFCTKKYAVVDDISESASGRKVVVYTKRYRKTDRLIRGGLRLSFDEFKETYCIEMSQYRQQKQKLNV